MYKIAPKSGVVAFHSSFTIYNLFFQGSPLLLPSNNWQLREGQPFAENNGVLGNCSYLASDADSSDGGHNIIYYDLLSESFMIYLVHVLKNLLFASSRQDFYIWRSRESLMHLECYCKSKAQTLIFIEFTLHLFAITDRICRMIVLSYINNNCLGRKESNLFF